MLFLSRSHQKVICFEDLGIQGRLRKRPGKRTGWHRGTGRGAPRGSGEPGHGGPEEAEEVIVIAEALKITVTVTWVV
jgi:hypothetical protein